MSFQSKKRILRKQIEERISLAGIESTFWSELITEKIMTKELGIDTIFFSPSDEYILPKKYESIPVIVGKVKLHKYFTKGWKKFQTRNLDITKTNRVTKVNQYVENRN